MSLACIVLALPVASQADGAALARNCAHCHGLTGTSTSSLIPHIGGQKARYLKDVLMAFKQGKRPSLFMTRLAKGYTDQELEAVADTFAGMAWAPASQATDPGLVEQGRELAQQRCVACHGTNQQAGSENAPRIAGQWAEYLKVELDKFTRPQMRSADPGMLAALNGLGAKDLEALSHYYASQR